MRRIVATLVGVGVLALTLTGCGETLEERIQNRDACEAAGGKYFERINGWTNSYGSWDCDLSTNG